MIRHVGQQLASRVVALLSPAHSAPKPNTPVVHYTNQPVYTRLDLSQVQRKDLMKEPPTLKGKNTDSVDVNV